MSESNRSNQYPYKENFEEISGNDTPMSGIPLRLPEWTDQPTGMGFQDPLDGSVRNYLSTRAGAFSTSDVYQDVMYTPQAYGRDMNQFFTTEDFPSWPIGGVDMNRGEYMGMDNSPTHYNHMSHMTPMTPFSTSPNFHQNQHFMSSPFAFQSSNTLDFGFPDTEDIVPPGTPTALQLSPTPVEYAFSPWKNLSSIPEGRPIENNTNTSSNDNGPVMDVAVESKEVTLSSIGSAQHPNDCRPCAFFFTKGCVNGADCRFCHEWHPPKKKKPMKEQKNLMIIARPDGKIEFMRCTVQEAMRVL